ncbi:MAG: GH36-type glycosyl hydrolase domain-containing protein, partial [Bryobacteraceae bacterium]
MPLLFLRTFSGSLLDRACRDAVEFQIEFGQRSGLPWGLSECAYSALDQNQIYQYRAFGVPELALKRGLEDERVIAPYATMLALMVDPAAAIENLKHLESVGLAGPMGLYEAIDFTRERKAGQPGVVIYTYMAHHQGMSLIALDNVLHHGALRRRFHDDPRVRAFESLLFERVSIARAAWHQARARHTLVREPVTSEPAERTWSEPTAVPRVYLAGNGRYTLMLTNSGGGYSRWGDFDLTRWRSDRALDPWGSFIYIRDLRAYKSALRPRSIWSAARNPVGGEMGTSAATFSPDRAEFQRRVSGIETTLHAIAAADDDVELRRLTAINRTLRSREIEFTSYLELALAPHRADAAHPAFSKLFIETEYLGGGALIAHRRLRSPDEPQVWAAHVLIGPAAEIQYETDRAKFLGRGKTPAHAEALERDLSNSAGDVLDPIFSLRCRVTLEPRQRLDLAFLTMAAPSREALLALIEKYRQLEAPPAALIKVTRAFEMVWTRTQLGLRYLGLHPADVHRYQALAGQLLYPAAAMRPPASLLARNRLGQTALWAYGISGDLPIVTVTVADSRALALARELILAHAYWRMLGFHADLVVLNQESPNYDQPLRQQLMRQIEAHCRDCVDRPGGVFLRDWNAIPEEHRDLILAASSAVLSGARGSLEQQISSPVEPPAPPVFVAATAGREAPSRPLPFLELPYFNGLGGFTQDGREYAIYVAEGNTTPKPWVNVIANSAFGAMVSEAGLGCTWSQNSQTNRLTPWHNDPVSDPQPEAIYIRDEDGAVWTPTPLPIRENEAYRARHGQGYTVFEHNSHGIGQELSVFVPVDQSVKVYRLRLRNDSSRARTLSVYYFAEWVLGSVREQQQLHVRTSFDRESGALLAGQTWTGESGRVAFAAANPRALSFSGDRCAFLGRGGSRSNPAAVRRISLDGRTGPALDPCAALQTSVAIEPGAQTEIVFLLGEARDVAEVRRIVSAVNVDRELESVRRQWDSILGTLQVRTPILSIDLLLNRWLLYQTLSCRFWGRSALYQSSGAFGFRDQLQDSLALVYSAPHLTRRHILASAARQFPEGD